MTIRELTEADKAQFPRFIDKWVGIGLACPPTNEEEAIRGVLEAYKAAGLKEPKNILFCNSPHELVHMKDKVCDKSEKKDAVPLQQLYYVNYGNMESWLSYYDCLHELCGEDIHKLEGLIRLAMNAGWWIPYEYAAFIGSRPLHILRDERGQLHSTDKAAVLYPKEDSGNQWGVYAVHGVRIPEYIITHPEEITVTKIDDEENVEVRRVMIERFGQDRYLEDGGAVLVHEDRFGQLFKKEVKDDEPIFMVRLVNSTPELDGTNKIYFERVPPDMKTARQAVAWRSYHVPSRYDPQVET